MTIYTVLLTLPSFPANRVHDGLIDLDRLEVQCAVEPLAQLHRIDRPLQNLLDVCGQRQAAKVCAAFQLFVEALGDVSNLNHDAHAVL